MLPHLQAAAYGSGDGKLTNEMIEECVQEMIEQHRQKSRWQDDESDKI